MKSKPLNFGLGVGGNGYVHNFDCGDSFMMYTYVKNYEIVHFKYV